MEKPDLILVNGFGSNKKILSGAVKLFQDYFQVHFIELPGSVTGLTLKKYDITSFRKYVQKEINDLNLKEYILGSLSLGFIISDNLSLPGKCLGILAMEPYLGKKYLDENFKGRALYSFLLGIICTLKIYNLVWKSPKWHKMIAGASQGDLERKYSSKELLSEFEAKAYFETANLVIKYNKKNTFYKLPHILIINPDDEVLDAPKTTKIFKKNVKELLIIPCQFPHVPFYQPKSFFEKHISNEELKKIYPFFLENER